ncbi:hypothetical protein H2198_008424 [Neophaeococcomyces mojaviensis]|uniref:Uncharacterized protein n=1 Tax=Neophaeococcomyces mojaviensis TaxID=3383035 RepID=A0ACC2ZX79_9EURO|nr:hypothetical protein H2198_008424 [Knufia sp. JES_112]
MAVDRGKGSGESSEERKKIEKKRKNEMLKLEEEANKVKQDRETQAINGGDRES